jgi:rubredoxin
LFAIVIIFRYILAVKFMATMAWLLKIYQCQNCHAVFKDETGKEEHGRGDPTHQKYREYELDEFLTRFLMTV